MNVADILGKVVQDLSGYFAHGVDIRTEGGDQEIDPPEIIISWTTSDITNQGEDRSPIIKLYDNTGFGEGTVGDTSYGVGELVGYRWQQYREINMTFTARYHSEGESMMALRTIRGYFSPFQTFANRFHEDTFEWDIGSIRPANSAFAEPDWYEHSLDVSCNYVSYHDDTSYDRIEEIDIDMETNG